MNEQTTDWFVIIIAIPMCVSFIILFINIAALRLLFLSDKKIKKWDRYAFGLLGMEAGYIIDLPEEHKSKYLKKVKAIKPSGIAFAVCMLLLISKSIISIW